MKHFRMKAGVTLIAATLVLAGCATDEFGNPRQLTETEKGVGIGIATGAAIGALATKKSAQGAAVGAVVGALGGGLIGNYMEQQRRDFQKVLANEIAAGDIRLEKLPDESLVVAMTSETAFDVDSSSIKPGFYSTMDKIAGVVNKYGKTRLYVSGHTDDTGSDAYNQGLSERRAQAVQSYLLSANVYPQRLSARGYGESQPVASNATAEGRRLNRRVDITIVPVQQG